MDRKWQRGWRNRINFTFSCLSKDSFDHLKMYNLANAPYLETCFAIFLRFSSRFVLILYKSLDLFKPGFREFCDTHDQNKF